MFMWSLEPLDERCRCRLCAPRVEQMRNGDETVERTAESTACSRAKHQAAGRPQRMCFQIQDLPPDRYLQQNTQLQAQDGHQAARQGLFGSYTLGPLRGPLE